MQILCKLARTAYEATDSRVCTMEIQWWWCWLAGQTMLISTVEPLYRGNETTGNVLLIVMTNKTKYL